MSDTDPPGSAHSTSGAADAALLPADASAPLPTDVQPFPISCPCLNVQICGYASNAIVKEFNSGKEAKLGECVQVYLPEKGEVIKHMPMSTFDQDGDEAWRKCWVCRTRVYRIEGKLANDKLAPIHAWVEVNLSNGVIYGDKIDETKKCAPLAYSGLVLDLPTTSTFGRPPLSTTPVPYPAEPPVAHHLLPPIPDPFFLPPPFIPNHPALRVMCRAAVAALQERHNEIERDIREYIVQRAQDMKRLEDQVRAEVEALWDRYVQGPLGGQDVDRRGSVSTRTSLSVPTSNVPPSNTAPATQALEEVGKSFQRDLELESLPSGVVPDPPSIGSQFNAHTAVASASLLSASLATNTFHPPPPRARPAQNEVDIDALTKAAANDRAYSKDVAMSLAFSAMEEHASGRRRTPAEEKKDEKKKELQETEEVEEEAEEREKGIDSWAAMERSQATKAITEEVKNPVVTAVQASDGVANGSTTDKKGRVHFQEPDKSAKEKDKKIAADAPDGDDDDDDDDDDDGKLIPLPALTEDYVFDMEADDIGSKRTAVEQPPVKAPERTQVRTMVEDNLSRTFAAEAPSHRAAWRAVEERGLASVLRHSPHDDDDEDVDVSPSDNLARSVPITITKPPRASAPLERKTSLTDKEGVLVPGLMGAMRRAAPVAIVGSMGTLPARRGSRSVSGDRERSQVMSYAADPGAIFESLAESAVSDDEDEPQPANGKFVPPHVLAQREADKGNSLSHVSGWGSLRT